MASRIQGPCRADCPDRTRGVIPPCHSYCEKYKAYKEEVMNEKKREIDARMEGSAARGFLVERSIARKKRGK